MPRASLTELSQIVAAAKDLAHRYYRLTGKPLGVTGEIAELEAARILDLALAPRRQAGWDASRALPDGRVERLQIKGRWMVKGWKPSAKIGRIDLAKEFDAVLLVLFDEHLVPIEIHRAEYAAVADALRAPGSTARNKRGQLSLSKFKAIGMPVWTASAVRPDSEVEKTSAVASPSLNRGPWTLDQLRIRLNERVLTELCRAHDPSEKRNRREHILERELRDTLSERYGSQAVLHGAAIGAIIGQGNDHLLSHAIPDVVLKIDRAFHICEVKSGRVDYNRHHQEPGQDWFRSFLASLGENQHQRISEVEQDLIRLRFYREISPAVQSCLFVMVCAYPKPRSSWTTAFGSAKAFRAKMKTLVMQDLAVDLIERTTIRTIVTESITARLIVCDIPRV